MYIQDESGNKIELLLSPSGDTYPIGMMAFMAGDKAPTNWLRCDGQEISRTNYAELFDAIGTTYGTGDGSTTFNLPNVNLENRTLVGSSGDGEFSVGNTGGEKEHALTSAENGPHTHNLDYDYLGYRPGTTSGIDSSQLGVWTLSSKQTTSSGNGTPHNNMPPFMASVCCIKAKQSAGIVGDVTDDINDTNDNAVPNAKTVKDYVDNKSKRQIATVYLNNDVSNVGAKKIPFDVINSNSAELTLNSNGIKIGKGISKVLVSGNAFLQKKTTGYLWTHILVNNTEASISLDNTSTGFASTSHAPKLVDVKENDIIYLSKIDDDLGTIRGKVNTYLTIEVVE